MTTITVICPNGVREGQPISITHPHTQQMLQVLVPRGVVAGQQCARAARTNRTSSRG